MRIVVEDGDVEKGVRQFKNLLDAEDDGGYVDISNVDYVELRKAVQDEYDCGARGSVLDVIQDLYDSIGLEDFGFIERDYDEPEFDDSCGMTDMEADADVLRNAGMGTDEDYGLFHDDYEGSYHDHLERDHDEPYEGE